jgi:hypothetical protein
VQELTPHLHLLVPEALWKPDGEVVPLGPPGDEDVARVLHRVPRQRSVAFEVDIGRQFSRRLLPRRLLDGIFA